jgi:hypothetical protein
LVCWELKKEEETIYQKSFVESRPVFLAWYFTSSGRRDCTCMVIDKETVPGSQVVLELPG